MVGIGKVGKGRLRASVGRKRACCEVWLFEGMKKPPCGGLFNGVFQTAFAYSASGGSAPSST